MWHSRMLLLFVSLLLSRAESNHITFSGFAEGDTYTYYTNGDNAITELTCVATATDASVTSISTFWYLKASNAETNTNSNVLRFDEIAAGLKWGQNRAYFCRAVYNIGQEQQQEDSGNIVVALKYNTTITVSYGDTVYVRDITNRERVPIPVMTEGVAITCDAEGGEWSYSGQTAVTNPINIDLFTIEYSVTFHCTKRDTPSGPRRTVHSVEIQAVGSGMWLEQQSGYRELSEGETVLLTEDRTLVCVSSAGASYTAWYYRGNSNTGPGERIADTILEESRGFLKLNLPISLPANRTGYYYCISYEYSIVTGITQSKQHSIMVSLPTGTTAPAYTTETTTTTTTTTTATTTTAPVSATTTITTPVSETTTTTTTTTTTPVSPVPISVQLSYTPNYRVVFVGVDDVTLICLVSSYSSNSIVWLHVSLVDTETGSILSSQTGNQSGEIRLQERLELWRGDRIYMCSVDAGVGGREDRYVSVRAEDPYTQEIVNVRTESVPGGREVALKWDTSHPLLANETFTIWIHGENGTSGGPGTGTTDSTEYPLVGLSLSSHYSIRIQVASRLGSSNASLYYIHTEGLSPPPDTYAAAAGIIGGLFLLLVMVLVCGVLVLVTALLLRRRKYSYTKDAQGNVPAETGHKSKEYIPLSGFDTMVAAKSSPGYNYELMESVAPPHSDYYPLEIALSMNYYEVPSNELIPKNVSPDKPEIPLASLKLHLDTLWENGMQGLALEFDQLHLNLLRDTQEQGKLEINRNLNIDRTTLPYDTTRVLLHGGTDNDYINASLIPGLVTNRNFISTHFPTHGTEVRFWRMVWEQRISCVLIAATGEEVLGVRRHLPQSDSPRAMGPLKLHFISEEVVGECVVCRCVGVCLAKNPSQVREVVFVEYSGWPVNEHSMLTTGLLESVRRTREFARDRRDAPICVLCNTGCGRSGCAIAVYNLLDSVLEGRRSVSVFNCVNGMRNHRPCMVQTLNQYRIIHTTLLEIVHGDTSVNMCGVTLGEGRMRSEFEELEYQCLKAFQRPCSVGEKYDTSGLPLPYDDTRVAIEPPATSHLSYAYYNASYIRSVASQTNQFIAATSPSGGTVCQFMEALFQHKCPLVIALGSWNAATRCARYWEMQDETFDCLQLSCLSTTRKEALLVSELKLKRISTNKPHLFTHILYDRCSEEVSSGRYESLLGLLDTLLEHKRDPVLVHCGDGVGVSGVLLGAFYAVKRGTERTGDIFQACKLLRLHRGGMVHTQEQYQACYSAVRQYIDTRLAQSYENISSDAS